MQRPWPRGRTCGRGPDSKELIQLDGGVEVSWAQGADVARRRSGLGNGDRGRRRGVVGLCPGRQRAPTPGPGSGNRRSAAEAPVVPGWNRLPAPVASGSRYDRFPPPLTLGLDSFSRGTSRNSGRGFQDACWRLRMHRSPAKPFLPPFRSPFSLLCAAESLQEARKTPCYISVSCLPRPRSGHSRLSSYPFRSYSPA